MSDKGELQDPRIEEALNKILESTSFASSKQSQALLKYLVAESLHGENGSLKERMIGVNVFGRPHDYNTGDDPIARARVGELRKRLASYYQHELVDQHAVRFTIPTGSYRVAFTYLSEQEEGAGGDVLASLLAKEPFPRSRISGALFARPFPAAWNRWIALLVACVVAAAVLTGVLYYRGAHSVSVLDDFWSPVAHSSQSVIVYLGQNSAYMPTASYMEHIRESRPPDEDEKLGTEVRLEDLKTGETLEASDVYAENNDLVSAGNISASIQVATLLASLRCNADVRTGEGMSAADLEHSSAVFLGAFDNRWTMQISRVLPFRFERIGGVTEALVEHDGQKRVWVTKIVRPDGGANEEYAIVARLPSLLLRKPVILAAGLRSAGTRAAGDFMTDPTELSRFLENLPSDWRQKNLEVVLRVEIVKGGPGTPVPIAFRVW
jgi:hypothetical protein